MERSRRLYTIRGGGRPQPTAETNDPRAREAWTKRANAPTVGVGGERETARVQFVLCVEPMPKKKNLSLNGLVAPVAPNAIAPSRRATALFTVLGDTIAQPPQRAQPRALSPSA